MTNTETLTEENRNDRDRNEIVEALLASASIEVAKQSLAAASDPIARVPAGTDIFLPFLPGARFIDNLDDCRRLAGMGLNPMPHIAARALNSKKELAEGLSHYMEAGAAGFMLIAGDQSDPAGPFQNTLDVIDSGWLADNGVKRLGIAGHPDGHPVADQSDLIAAIKTKIAYGQETGTQLRIVTQFLFDAESLVAWEQDLRDNGIALPVYAGFAGPAKLSTLIGFALKCGVGNSARMLTKRPSAARLLGRWSPEPVFSGIVDHLTQTPESLIEGIHLYPFGGLGSTLDWIAGQSAATGQSAGS